MKAKFSREDSVKIAQLLTLLTVNARFAQHIAWEMQYAMNELGELGVETQKIADSKEKLFNIANRIEELLHDKYDQVICNEYRPDGYSEKHPVFRAYDGATHELTSMDALIRQEADRLYKKSELYFREVPSFYEDEIVNADEEN